MSFIKSLQELNSITIVDNVNSWKDAITLCFKPLLERQYITENYIQSVIHQGQELNFYYLLSPGLGMPHARPENGVLKNGFSLLIVKNGVKFEDHDNNPIYCLIGLAATDNSGHIDAIMDISDIFGDNNFIIENLRNSVHQEKIIELLSK